MIDVSVLNPFVACTEFAVKWLAHIAAYDLPLAEAMIDVNETGRSFSESFPTPDGFTYSRPSEAECWNVHFVAVSETGFSLHFELPFVEREYRAMMARFDMKRRGNFLEVTFEGLVPT